MQTITNNITQQFSLKRNKFYSNLLTISCFLVNTLVLAPAGQMGSSDEFADRWRRSFETFDVNKSGCIDSEELKKLMQVCVCV